MVGGFRRMLRGICDGEVLLNGQLKIQGSGVCLNTILSTSGNFGDKSFLELLVDSEEEHDRFHDFIAASRRYVEPEMQGGMPPCLRVSLQGVASHRVGVDIFHVALCNLYGTGDCFHLLAMRQDSEPQPWLAEQTDPTEPSHATLAHLHAPFYKHRQISPR